MTGWCFAKVNGKLAEIYFDKEKGKLKILGHAFVKKEEFKTEKEEEMIQDDTAKYQFSYRNKQYKNLLRHIKIKKLSALLNEWDPIGIKPNQGGPKDEYSCLLKPLLNLLSEGTNEMELSVFLNKQLMSHFGINPQAKKHQLFAKKILKWWRLNN